MANPRLTAALVPFALVGGVFAACGGDGGLTFDPDDADDISHDILLSERDLPGKGWELVAEDEFDDDEDPFPADSDACDELNGKINETNELSRKAEAGRASREWERESDNAPFPLSVEHEVNVFDETKSPSSALKTTKEVTASKDFTTCLADVMKEAVAEDPSAKVKTKSVKTRISAPSGGAAYAVEIEISTKALNVVMRLETYMWLHKNAGTTVTFSGAADEVTKDLVEAVMAKAKKSVEDAAKK